MENVIIRLPKMLLILTEHELLQALSATPDIFKKAIGRGKGYKRAQSVLHRETAGFASWHLYEALKKGCIDNELKNWVEGMPIEEVKTGLLEYFEFKMRETR